MYLEVIFFEEEQRKKIHNKRMEIKKIKKKATQNIHRRVKNSKNELYIVKMIN